MHFFSSDRKLTLALLVLLLAILLLRPQGLIGKRLPQKF